MFKFGQIPLPKLAQKPNKDRNPLEIHDNIFVIEDQEKE